MYGILNIYSNINILELISDIIQSIPFSSPSPVNPQHGIIIQCLVVIESKSRSFFISSTFKAPLISCLLQRTINVAPASLSCFNKLCNSSLQSDNLSLSLLSTTQMTPSVSSK